MVNSGQMKFPAWVKQVFGTVAVVGTMLAWFVVYYVPAKIDSQTQGLSNDVSSLKTDMADVKGNVQRIDTNVNGLLKDLLEAELRSLKGISKQPPNIVTEKLRLVSDVVDRARQAGIHVNPSIVADAGNSALEASANSALQPVAWKTSQQLLDYRSYLTPKPAPPESAQTGPTSKMWSTSVLPFTVTSVTVYSFTTNREEMARYEQFNEPRNETVPNGPSLIALNGAAGDLDIDDHVARNVIFDHLHIIYKGGRLELRNVLFVDCTFDILTAQPRGVSFARALFQAVPTNFNS
jgi:hypothetical protein